MKTKDHAGANRERMNLLPQQELELVKYIEGLSAVGLSPTRAMIRNFGTFIAKKPCSELMRGCLGDANNVVFW